MAIERNGVNNLTLMIANLKALMQYILLVAQACKYRPSYTIYDGTYVCQQVLMQIVLRKHILSFIVHSFINIFYFFPYQN